MRAGRDLEELSARIKTLLHPNARVQSPANILDVDTGQQREIDVLVSIPGKPQPITIAVECRDRASRQDVTWIEQLIAKKESIGVDLLIAVSSSPFTEPAILKAAKRGVLIRQVVDSLPPEIALWANETYVELSLVRVGIANPVLLTKLGVVSTNAKSRFILKGHEASTDDVVMLVLQPLFPTVAPRLKQHGQTLPLKIEQPVSDLLVKLPYELPVQRIMLRAHFRRHIEKLPLASGFTYDDSIAARRLVQGFRYGDEGSASEVLVQAETKKGRWRVDFRDVHGWFEHATLKAVEPVALTAIEIIFPNAPPGSA